MESSSAGISRSGRLRKKSTKVIEMEQISIANNNNNNSDLNETGKLSVKDNSNYSLLTPGKPKLKIKISSNAIYNDNHNHHLVGVHKNNSNTAAGETSKLDNTYTSTLLMYDDNDNLTPAAEEIVNDCESVDSDVNTTAGSDVNSGGDCNSTIKRSLNNSAEIVPPFKIRIVSPVAIAQNQQQQTNQLSASTAPTIKITSPTNKKFTKKLINQSNGSTLINANNISVNNNTNNNNSNTLSITKPIKLNRKSIENETPANRLFNQITAGVTSTPIDRKRKKYNKLSPLSASSSSSTTSGLRTISSGTKLFHNDDNYEDDDDDNGEASLMIADSDESLAAAVEQARRVTKPKMLKTSVEKREEKRAKQRSKFDKSIDGNINGTGNSIINHKEKTKRRTPLVTAYTLFARYNRQKIQESYPGADFATVSKRLGEVWQALPTKEKQQWKKRALKVKEENEIEANERDEANKLKLAATNAATAAANAFVTPPPPPPAVRHRYLFGSTKSHQNRSSPISTIKSLPTSASTSTTSLIMKNSFLTGPASSSSTQLKSQSSLSSSSSSSSLSSPAVTMKTGFTSHNSALSSTAQASNTATKLTITVLDVSAQLRLLGESLTLIGERLKESSQLTVSGSLSLLLDSTLCALGPLMCLTTLSEDLNGCSRETHEKTIDNLSYIMPGI